MAITTVTNHLVFPSENDVHGGSSGAGKIGQELTLASLWTGLGGANCVVSGWSPIPTGAGLTKSIPGGVAVINGYVVKGTGSPSFTFEASASNLSLFLVLTFDGSSKVNGVQLESYTGTTIPANSVRLARVVTDGTGVTSQTDRRPQNRHVYGKVASDGTYADTGSGNWSSTKNSTGNYTITVASGVFFRAPAIVVTPTFGSPDEFSADATSATSITVLTGNPASDSAFSFIASL